MLQVVPGKYIANRKKKKEKKKDTTATIARINIKQNKIYKLMTAQYAVTTKGGINCWSDY